jgi:hypothetical protein
VKRKTSGKPPKLSGIPKALMTRSRVRLADGVSKSQEDARGVRRRALASETGGALFSPRNEFG